MKKILYLSILLLSVLTLDAQEIIFDELPPAIREDLLNEEVLIDELNPPEEQELPGEEGYYYGPARDMVTDTIYFYHWNRQQETWISDHRKIRTIDGSGLLTEMELEHRTPAGEWKNGLLRLFLYNSSGNPVEITTQVWHPVAGDYLNHHRTLRNYQDDTLFTDATLFKWHHQTQAWANKKRVIRAFDGNNLWVADTSYLWRPFAQSWTYVRLNEYMYDPQGYRVEHLTSFWNQDSLDWRDRKRALIGYANGLRDTVVMQFYFAPHDEWINAGRNLHLYDSGNRLIEKVHQKWFPGTGLWGNHDRSLFAYNGAGKLEEAVFQAWQPVLQEWKNKRREEFSYDASGSLQQRLTQLWHHPDSAWVNFRLMQLVIEYKSAFAGTGENNMFNEGEKMVFSNPGTVDKPVTFESLKPGANYRFNMYSASGALLRDAFVTEGDNIFPASDTGPGLYLLVLTRDGAPVATGKLMITK